MARLTLVRLLGAALAYTTLVAAAPPPVVNGGLTDDYGYVELADMAFAAPLAVAADIVSAVPLKPAEAGDVPPGKTRYYVHADVRALVSGRADLPPQVSYLVDLPTDKKRKLKAVPVLLLAAPTARSGELRLVGARAQVPRTPDNEARLRSILTASVAADAPPQVTGVQRAFHVAGSLPGESETQIFLRTADRRPISLNVLRRPGERPRWAVALTELVDDSAAPPKPDSLLWYRLACGLPQRLPEGAVTGQSPEDADAARADYQVVLTGLGPCRHAG
ncbi:hypothetical protein [Sphingomonas nostoxanthinifaciens]|uniref:hypothetical protein n=1 Tax=Sphingomonas nostoxanthinifaciens TaxID=2872652 RepID=UPI001CC1DE5F|nr:hypothetical protein [Sphingomonas nostoxanthinifaciens]